MRPTPPRPRSRGARHKRTSGAAARTGDGQPRDRRRRHGSGRARRRLAALLGCLLLAGTGLGSWLAYDSLNDNLSTTDVTSRLGSDRPPRTAGKALNILLLGSDSRAGDNAAYGGHVDGARSDTAMLVHLNGDHTAATVVSVPRDTVVHRPPCVRPDGTTAGPASAAMFNTAYAVAGSPCTVKTLESLSRIRVDHVVEVDFTGFKKLIDTIGGVEVKVPQDIHDPKSGLDLTRGEHRLDGEQALALVRTRYGIGDGSDLGRIRLQQLFLSALAVQMKADHLLTNPVRLYRIADAATSALTTDEELGSLKALSSLAHDFADVAPDAIDFHTLPVEPYPEDPNRVQPAEPAATHLWNTIRRDGRGRG
ncbi:LCP family protein [Streptomyces sp. Da 82-17]|uniref:LCP family protein n=1 Tax=Streptomyces sp. Da 82-17 TaxID=3377116 RepID=UPI0038D4EDF3